MSSLIISHNIEVAHRLFMSPGKCQAIHGHSMWVDLELLTPHGTLNGMYVNKNGEPMEFGALKKEFRNYLDTNFDHHVLLNNNDPWAQDVYAHGEDWENGVSMSLPGLVPFDGDPTTENIANQVARWCSKTFFCDTEVTVHETAVNAARAGAYGSRRLVTSNG